jgi:hypothetical protein
MARKSKRKSVINWKPVLGTALCINVIVGLLFSPITSVRHIRIVGAQPHDTQRLNALAQGLRGVPFMVVPTTKLEGSVMASRDVYNAELNHNLFGSAVLRVQYRQPVAELVDPPHIYLDNQGVLYGSPEAIQGVRQLGLDPEYLQPTVALTLPWPSTLVADLCVKLNSFDQLKDAVVHVDTTGRLWLSEANAGKVDLGGSDQLDEKLRKLKRLLDDDPQLLTRVRSLSLTDPTHPALDSRKSTNQ